MTHNRTLIGTIGDKATASWLAAGNDIGYSAEYQKHWLDTAKKWRDELQAEGLNETAESVRKIIRFFEKE